MLIILKSSIKELAKIKNQDNSLNFINFVVYLSIISRTEYRVDIYIKSFNLSRMI